MQLHHNASWGMRWRYLSTVSTLNVRPSREARKLIRSLRQGKTIRAADRNRLLAVIGLGWGRTEN
ncbi:hypothetical protein BZ160_10780 [Pantoea vagans]|nr:hypothetical protein BZ160_10780 [Pantoea vagans]